MKRLPQTASCFACGKDHPSGLRLAMHTDGDSVRCLWTPRHDQIGFQQAIHGGLIATALDEVMAWACGILAGKFAYSVEINVRYRKIVLPGAEVECVGKLTTKANRRLLHTQAELLAGGEILATATGKYVPIKNFDRENLHAEFGENASQLLPYLEFDA